MTTTTTTIDQRIAFSPAIEDMEAARNVARDTMLWSQEFTRPELQRRLTYASGQMIKAVVEGDVDTAALFEGAVRLLTGILYLSPTEEH